MGVLPTALTVLTAIATNAQNITAGPFMAAIPTPPSMAWAPLTPTAPTPTAPSIRSRPPPAHRRPDDRRSPIERPNRATPCRLIYFRIGASWVAYSHRRMEALL